MVLHQLTEGESRPVAFGGEFFAEALFAEARMAKAQLAGALLAVAVSRTIRWILS